MLFNPKDTYIGRSLEVYGEFSQGEVELFDAVLSPDHVVLDIGANIGAHTVFFAKKVQHVIAFEPQRLVFQTLCANVALNNLTNVHTHQVAVGNEPGELLIPVLDPEAENNFGGLPAMGHSAGEPVPLLPIDMMDLARVDFIKIDVEGAELEVLKGATQTINRFKPVLYVEDDREENRESLHAYLDEVLEYEFDLHTPLLFNPDNHAGVQENVFGHVASLNLVCTPK